MPKPIIIQEADAVHARDESQSCHVSVSHCDGGKVNYRWLNVPFFSPPPPPGRTHSWKEGTQHVRRRLPLIVLLKIPPVSSDDHQPYHCLQKKKAVVNAIGYNILQAITRVMHSNRDTEIIHTLTCTHCRTQTIWGSDSKSNCCEHEAS